MNFRARRYLTAKTARAMIAIRASPPPAAAPPIKAIFWLCPVPTTWKISVRDLSEIKLAGGGGVKFANPPLDLGLKYHDPPPLVKMIKSNSCNTLGWVSIMKAQNIFLHDPPPFKGLFFMTPPFPAVSKSFDPPSVSTPPPPLLISWQVP